MPRRSNPPPPAKWRHALAKYIADHPDRPLKARGLARELGISSDDYFAFRTLIRNCLAEGALVLGSGRTLRLPRQIAEIVGTFHVARGGYGFIESPGREDLFVARGSKLSALDGDNVAARITRPGRGKLGPRAEIVRIIERAPINWVGVLRRDAHGYFVQPQGRKPLPVVRVNDGTACGSQVGDLVVISPSEESLHRHSAAGVIRECLGDPDRTRNQIFGVIRRFALPIEFPEEVTGAATEAAAADSDEAVPTDRDDLRDLLTITIDPPDARDFDDAISVRAIRGGLTELGVHIADVAHYVRPGGAVDVEARKRSTSAYFPRWVIPMLPEVLSNEVCSLRPGQPRLTKSAFITYDANAEVIATRFANSVICSKARLTYAEASAVLDGDEVRLSTDVKKLVQFAAKLARKIRERRLKNGMIELELPETEIVLDEAGEAIDARPAEHMFSHKIIEMFMVEANEAVCRRLVEGEVAQLRRIHPPPETDDLRALKLLCDAIGCVAPRTLDQASIRELIEHVADTPQQSAVQYLLLRSMAQACYSPEQVGHFALASEHYCHFTSPIRRYPDLTIHRALDGLIRRAQGPQSEREQMESELDLAALGREASGAERRAQQAERDTTTLLVLGMMRERLGETFDGTIIGVASFGVFVQLAGFPAEGVIHIEDFGPDAWDHDEQHARFIGRRSRQAISLGQAVRVVAAAVDLDRLELTLVLDGQEGEFRKSDIKSQASARVKPVPERRGRRGRRLR